MRRLRRRPLSPGAQEELSALTAKVTTEAKSGRKKRAASLWKQRPAVLQEVREVLGAMATGRGRCMYCEDSSGTDIDHFYPKGRYPERAFRWDNYLLACSHCNSNQKREQFPLVGGRPGLIDPTRSDPVRHLAFTPATGELHPLTAKGRHTVKVFGLNDSTTPRALPRGRSDAFAKLQSLLLDYHRSTAADRIKLKGTILREPFSAVLGYLVQFAMSRAAHRVLRPGVAALVRKHQVAHWLSP